MLCSTQPLTSSSHRQCIHCKRFIKGGKQLHEGSCGLKTLGKIPRKRARLEDE